MMAPGFGAIDPWGVAASVGAMLSSSLGFVLTVRWGRGVPPLTMTAWQLTAGGLLLLPFAVLVKGLPPALDPPAVAGFVYVILVATVVAYGAWFTGLQRLPAGTVGLLGLLNPLTGVALGVVVAGEPFGVVQAIGVALVVTGVALGVGGRRKRSVKVVPPTGIEPATFGTGTLYRSAPRRSHLREWRQCGLLGPSGQNRITMFAGECCHRVVTVHAARTPRSELPATCPRLRVSIAGTAPPSSPAAHTAPGGNASRRPSSPGRSASWRRR